MSSEYFILDDGVRSIYRRVGYTLPLLYRYCEGANYLIYILLSEGLSLNVDLSS